MSGRASQAPYACLGSQRAIACRLHALDQDGLLTVDGLDERGKSGDGGIIIGDNFNDAGGLGGAVVVACPGAQGERREDG